MYWMMTTMYMNVRAIKATTTLNMKAFLEAVRASIWT